MSKLPVHMSGDPFKVEEYLGRRYPGMLKDCISYAYEKDMDEDFQTITLTVIVQEETESSNG